MYEWEVRREVLSDNSVAWNVVGVVSDYPKDVELTIGATDQRRAREIADALNEGAAWALLGAEVAS